MLTSIQPKLPMRDKVLTKDFYTKQLGFQTVSDSDFDGYLMLEREAIEIHFFEFKALDPKKNYGQVYIRTNDIEQLYISFFEKNVIHPNGKLEEKPWGQKEFSVLDPDHNLLTFGQSLW